MATKVLLAIFCAFLVTVINVNCVDYAPSVIIVGAGPAGIAAASKLLENNITNITILEAEGRIGGRVHSVEFGDAIVDLGAQWCHGQENNTVYELVKNLNLLEPGDLSLHVYHSSRKHIDSNFSDELMEIYNEIYKGEKQCDDDASLGQYIIQRYNDSINEYYADDEEKAELARGSIDTVMKWILATEGSFTWFKPAAKSDYTECEGNQILNWKGRGYKTILDVLIRKFPNPDHELSVKDKLMLNQEVVKIVWDNSSDDDPQGVVVECADGSVYAADHVILTVSLGVLKDRYRRLFQPLLPNDKINAINELGIDAVAKVFLHFPVRWWPADFSDFTFIWNEEDIQTSLQEFTEGPNQYGKSWITNLMGFYATEGNPNVLTAWFCGEFIPLIELCSDDTIINGTMFALNKFLGHKFNNITKPDSLLRCAYITRDLKKPSSEQARHNWYSNPHFRGTYSYQTVESRKRGISEEVILSQPLTASSGKQTLLFAGEATHPIYYSTVHGAIETGYREAERLVNLYKEN